MDSKEFLKTLLVELNGLYKGISNIKDKVDYLGDEMAKESAEAAITGQTQNKESCVSQYTYVNDKGQTVLVKTVSEETTSSVTDESIVSDQANAEVKAVIAEAEAALKSQNDIKENLTKELEAAKSSLAELTKKLEDAEAKVELLTNDAEAKLTAVAKEKTEEAFKSFASAPLAEEFVKTLEFSDEELLVASKVGYKDMVKTLASTIKELETIKDTIKKEEVKKLGDVRFNELTELGVAFNGEKASEQKVKVSVMTDEAFASYKEDLKSLATSISLDPEEILRKTREKAGAHSVKVNDSTPKDKYANYNKFQ